MSSAILKKVEVFFDVFSLCFCSGFWAAFWQTQGRLRGKKSEKTEVFKISFLPKSLDP